MGKQETETVVVCIFSKTENEIPLCVYVKNNLISAYIIVYPHPFNYLFIDLRVEQTDYEDISMKKKPVNLISLLTSISLFNVYPIIPHTHTHTLKSQPHTQLYAYRKTAQSHLYIFIRREVKRYRCKSCGLINIIIGNNKKTLVNYSTKINLNAFVLLSSSEAFTFLLCCIALYIIMSRLLSLGVKLRFSLSLSLCILKCVDQITM